MSVAPYGRLRDGREVDCVTLGTDPALSVDILTFGGIVRSVIAPDRRGRPRNVVLGCADLAGYEMSGAYFGAIIGRFANRIAGGRFRIDGREVVLSQNAPPNSVHGGDEGFDRKIWTIEESDETSVLLGYRSPDGEEGYPGALDVSVRYSVTGGTLRVDYTAVTDAPTVVNLTNHSYFTLAGDGAGSILGHVLELDSDHYLPVDETLIPTGASLPVAGTAMDFRSPHTIGERIRAGTRQLQISRGYDHNYLLNRTRVDADGLAFAARCEHPESGRTLEIWTTEPAIDFYSGNFLDGTLVGPAGATYRQSDAFAIEPEHPSNAPNRPGDESTILRPGDVYRSATEYRFGVTAAGHTVDP